MDPCRVGANLNNSRAMIRTNLGVPKEYANKMSANAICKAYKDCRNTTILPPMDFHMVDGRGYCIDPKSPLSVKDYIVLFGEGDLTRIAKKVGLVPIGLSRRILKASIIDMLKSLGICEPIKLPFKGSPKTNNSFPTPVTNNGLPASNNGGGLPGTNAGQGNALPSTSQGNALPGGSQESPEESGLPTSSFVLPPKNVHPSRFKMSNNKHGNYKYGNYRRRLFNNDNDNYNYNRYKYGYKNKGSQQKKLEEELKKLANQTRKIKNEIGANNNSL